MRRLSNKSWGMGVRHRITHMAKGMTEWIFVVHARHRLFELDEITNSGFILCPGYEFRLFPFAE
jgi:hypothetical protein